MNTTDEGHKGRSKLAFDGVRPSRGARPFVAIRLLVLTGFCTVFFATPANGQSDTYAIQAFASTDSVAVAVQARALSERLGDAYEVRIVRSDGWFKLQVGEYRSSAAARPGLLELRRAGYDDAWVTRAPARVGPGSRSAAEPAAKDGAPSIARLTVQAFASADSIEVVEHAQALVETLGGEYPVRVIESGPWFKIHVGDFPTRGRADPALVAVQRSGYSDAWVVPGSGRLVTETRIATESRADRFDARGVVLPAPRLVLFLSRLAGLIEPWPLRAIPWARVATAYAPPAADPEKAPRPDVTTNVVQDPVVETAAASGTPDLAQRRIPIDLPRISGRIRLDGVIDEGAWAGIEPYPISVYSPTYGQDPTERSEFRVGYDDEYLYVAGSMFDSDPGGIEANTFYRDASSGDDEFSIVLDSYNDYETGLAFSANPNGARSDRSIANDAQFTLGQPTFNRDWNAHWDLATRTTAEGWFAEMRIPFSSLGFQTTDDAVVMGMSVYRSIGRKNERHVFPDVSPAWGFFGFGKPSLAQRVRLRGVQRSAPIYVTPYLLGGLSQVPVLHSPPEVAAAGFVVEDEYTQEPGLDVKWSPSSGLAIDLTVNTDFAQVEADDQQINLTRFPLFFPEKRQFFQARSSTFDFGTGGFTDRLFFSRRIGLTGGELTRIYGGARFVGQIGGLDYGLLSMQTAAQGDRPGENMSVARLSQQILNPFSSVGAMVTTRLGDTGENNVAYGLDATVRPFGDEYVTVKWAQTFDEVVEEGSPLDAGLIRAKWERRKQEGFSYAGEYGRVGPDYLPRLGFQSRKDFSFYGGELAYAWFLGENSSLRTVSLGLDTGHYYRNGDQTPESRSINPEFLVGLKNGGFFIFSSTSSFESVRDTFQVAGLTIEPNEYWFHEAGLTWRLPRSLPVRGQISGSAGSFYDGRRVGTSFTPAFNLSSHLELRPSYSINRFEFDGEDLTTQLASLRLDFALNTHLSLSTFGQYNSVIDQTSVNARLRYHFREGTDLWIVYNEGFNLERDNGLDPRLPLSAGRTLLLKYSHTFGF